MPVNYSDLHTQTWILCILLYSSTLNQIWFLLSGRLDCPHQMECCHWKKDLCKWEQFTRRKNQIKFPCDNWASKTARRHPERSTSSVCTAAERVTVCWRPVQKSVQCQSVTIPTYFGNSHWLRSWFLHFKNMTTKTNAAFFVCLEYLCGVKFWEMLRMQLLSERLQDKARNYCAMALWPTYHDE